MVCRRYGVLPSEIKNGTIDDLQFNILVANTGVDAENKNSAKATRRR